MKTSLITFLLLVVIQFTLSQVVVKWTSCPNEEKNTQINSNFPIPYTTSFEKQKPFIMDPTIVKYKKIN